MKRLLEFKKRIISIIGIPRNFYYLPLSGDWIQLIGLSLLLGSTYGLIFSIFIFPFIVHFMSISLMPPYTYDAPDVFQPTNSFVLTGWTLVVRTAVVSGIFLFFLNFLKNDIILFSGDLGNARSLLEMLVQTEATIFALVLSFLFVVVEFASSAYTPRLSKFIFNRLSFQALVLFSLTSITIKIMILSNENFFSNLMINWSLFFSVIFIVNIGLFTIDAFRLISPETLLAKALEQFNSDWIKKINKQWSSINESKTIFIEADPLIPVERMLVSALSQGDLITYSAGLIQIREKLNHLSSEIDKIALDNYLAASFESVIHAASKNNLDLALLYLCDNLVKIAEPSLDALRNAETRGVKYPPGCSSLSHLNLRIEMF